MFLDPYLITHHSNEGVQIIDVSEYAANLAKARHPTLWDGPQSLYQGITNNVRLTFGVGDTTWVV